MSDLEATSSRRKLAAPITAIASGKLRAFAGNGNLFADTDGLADPFAEVFARIATSSVQPIEPLDSSGDIESGQIAEDNKPVQADDGASTESESSDSDSATEANGSPLIVVADQQVVVEDEISSIDESNLAVDTESESLDKEPDQVVAEDLTIAAVEVDQSETADSGDTKMAEVNPQYLVETEDANEHRRDRRETPTVDLAEQTQGATQNTIKRPIQSKTSKQALKRINSMSRRCCQRRSKTTPSHRGFLVVDIRAVANRPKTLRSPCPNPIRPLQHGGRMRPPAVCRPLNRRSIQANHLPPNPRHRPYPRMSKR